MRIVRKSSTSNKINLMEIAITPHEYKIGLQEWMAGKYIQDAFPTLSTDEREFIKTGITPEEWDDACAKLEFQEDVITERIGNDRE